MDYFPHGTDEQLELYALSRLPEADVARMEEHLMVCAPCRARLDETEEFVLGMRDALGQGAGLESAPEPAPSLQPGTDWFAWLRRPAFSMAFAMAALVIVLGVFSANRTTFAPSASLQLTALRGGMPVSVPAREFDLTLSDAPRDGGPFRVAVVGATGGALWNGLAQSSPTGVHVKVQQRLAAGDYFVRLYSASGQILNEYGFRIRPR